MYSFATILNFAYKIKSPVTFSFSKSNGSISVIFLNHPANTYCSDSVEGFVGTFVGIAIADPYGNDALSIVYPSATNLIVYILSLASNFAYNVKFPLTVAPSKLYASPVKSAFSYHPANAYVFSTSASLLGSSGATIASP